MNNTINSQEATRILTENGLDFNISKRALYDGQGNRSEYYGLWNDKSGNCIHTVKESYRVSQNQEVVEMVLQGIEKYGSDLSVTKAGAMNDGRKIYLQLAIEGESRVGNDVIKRYITIIDSNDGSTSLSVGIGDLTMSCSNQFWKFYGKGNKMRHTATLEQKMKMLPEMIETALARSMKQMELYRVMAETPITDVAVHHLVKSVLGYDKYLTSMEALSEKSTRAINKMNDLYDAINSEIADKGKNLWGLHSGITYYTAHKNSAPKRENGRLESVMLGNGYTMNEKSLEFAVKYAKVNAFEDLTEILA
jgi:hypothetical protein